eukprot:gnl/MRDRNA2_/MRDRNA2_95898_c0_seq1.p1 gnl/MRDRNA2_/MRDRNA2_95898_c0~~gnl/MRDRNA2_/MRDRNA2_95898_c0_seq1.p1  ORF type:complete len:127 (-),score=30.58 gnl/MRDRNA2_/MRDRNA2_95898_c0_seq1:28-408(-)
MARSALALLATFFLATYAKRMSQNQGANFDVEAFSKLSEKEKIIQMQQLVQERDSLRAKVERMEQGMSSLLEDVDHNSEEVENEDQGSKEVEKGLSKGVPCNGQPNVCPFKCCTGLGGNTPYCCRS